MPAPVPSVTTITLRWLLRLRWVGLAGQVATLLFASLILHLDLPWVPLLCVITVAIATNFILYQGSAIEEAQPEWTIALVIAIDVVLLSIMLYFTGGASNPFTSFFLVLVALAAMSLGARWLAAIVALAIGCYAIIFWNGVPLRGPGGIGEIGCPGFGLHLQGMAVAFFLTSACIAYFVRKMHSSLQLRDAALTEMENKAARSDQFSALAAIAAGVAHELGSPLGTIAVASHELELALSKSSTSEGTLADAQLIRSEVERCRTILDRLDRRSTAGTGEAPEPCSIRMIIADLQKALPDQLCSRLIVRNLTRSQQFHLPRSPLVQSLLVLLQNASEADPSGEAIELEVSHSGNHLRLAVHDRGTGMSESTQKHAGEPFYTTKPPRQGMGLGLFLVRTLAMQLGGELSHRARSGGGTTAELQLPVMAS